MAAHIYGYMALAWWWKSSLIAVDDDADSDLELVPLRKKARNPSTLRQSAPAAVNHLRKSVDRRSPSISRDASHTEGILADKRSLVQCCGSVPRSLCGYLWEYFPGFDTENLETQSVRVQHQPGNLTINSNTQLTNVAPVSCHIIISLRA